MVTVDISQLSQMRLTEVLYSHIRVRSRGSSRRQRVLDVVLWRQVDYDGESVGELPKNGRYK